MRKEDMNIAIGIAGLAAAILLFGGGKEKDDSGYGGAFPLPLPLMMQSPGTVEPTQTLSGAQGLDSSFQISEKILAAMRGTIQPATTVYGGSSPQSKKELAIIEAAGFSTEGLKGSFDPWTNTGYTFAPETATVEKKIISRVGFSTEGLQGSFDPESGKITTFAGAGTVSYSQPTTKKEAAIASGGSYGSGALAGSSRPVSVSQQGGATVYTQSSGGGGGGGSRSGFSW